MSEQQDSGWQSIDTAPQDEDILVFTQNWGTMIARHSSEFDQWLSRMQVPVTMTGEEETPTHWRALPSAPEKADQPSDTPAAATS